MEWGHRDTWNKDVGGGGGGGGGTVGVRLTASGMLCNLTVA